MLRFTNMKTDYEDLVPADIKTFLDLFEVLKW
jgi:hypothetical protein